MNVAQAHEYARLMVHRESNGPGDTDNALERLERRYGISRWQLSHLRKRNAKTINTDLFHRLESAFINHCRRHANRLLAEAETAQAAGAADDDLAAIEDEVRALARRLETARRQAKAAPPEA